MTINLFGSALSPTNAVARIYKTFGSVRGGEAIQSYATELHHRGAYTQAHALLVAAGAHPAFADISKQIALGQGLN